MRHLPSPTARTWKSHPVSTCFILQIRKMKLWELNSSAFLTGGTSSAWCLLYATHLVLHWNTLRKPYLEPPHCLHNCLSSCQHPCHALLCLLWLSFYCSTVVRAQSYWSLSSQCLAHLWQLTLLFVPLYARKCSFIRFPCVCSRHSCG